ncbi:hypothetical protein GOODEAATRI_019929 [Goodea atripinnis]|uniref:Uncharacterized protein n=1 Tax=Goodea atripinnis TaxID=208336 RepID=A0ABV0NLP5_9TELE
MTSNPPRSSLAPFPCGNCLPVRSGGGAASAEGAGLHLYTHHEGGVPQGYPPVPALEPSLSAVFGVRSAWCVGQWPVTPSSSDQITARLTDRSHQCAAQVATATNNTAFLAYSISKKAREMELPPEDVEEFCNFADTILNLCAASAVCSSHIAAWQTLIQRQMWLWLYSIPKDFKRELLEGPFSSLCGVFVELKWSPNPDYSHAIAQSPHTLREASVGTTLQRSPSLLVILGTIVWIPAKGES